MGDCFLAEIFPALQTLSGHASSPLYLYKNYNVAPFYQNPSSMLRNSLSRILNAVAKALNERVRLPKYVLVIPDLDILSTINFYDFGMPTTFQKCAQWLVKQVVRFFQIRYEDLKSKRPGAVCGNTRIIWLNIINRPSIKNHPNPDRVKLLAGRERFNTALNDVICDMRYNHAMVIDTLTEVNHFTQFGNLSQYGQQAYWRELDKVFKKFDRHEVDLKPEVQHQPIDNDRRERR